MCVGYEHEGQRIDDFPYHQTVLHKVKPIYETLPGWKTDLTKVTDRSELPKQADEYLTFIEEQCAMPVTMVGVGPGRKQVLTFNQ